MDESLAREVRRRAGDACEYCRVPQACYPTVPFPIDHVIARQHGGATILGNLAYSCLHCNAHKGPNIAGVDPRTGDVVALFNPRTQTWADHFRMVRGVVVGRTSAGRATVTVCDMNAPDRVQLRRTASERRRAR